MASDSQDSHRKHRRSPSDEESPENSKRHKHRHHRHHRRHRHHHRHSSSKHGNAKKEERKEELVEEVVENVTKHSRLHDYDMEEGEIVDDEAEVAEKKVESDVESGEFMAADGATDFDDSYMQIADAGLENRGNDTSRKSTKYLKSPGNNQSGESKEDGCHSRHDELPVLEKLVNGDHASMFRKGESRSHMSCKPPLKESIKEKDGDRSDSEQQVLESLEADEDGCEDRRNLSYSHKARDVRHKATHYSPSLGRYNLETSSDRSWSESPERLRERERSQSIVQERQVKIKHHHEMDERLYDNGKAANEMDKGRDSHTGTDYRPNGREKANNRRRERSSSYHRPSVYEGKHHDGDSWDNETEEKMYRDRNMWSEKQAKRGLKEIGIKNERGSAEKTVKGRRILDRDFERERERERERKRERRREIDRGRSRDRDVERERRRDDSISMYRDRDTDRKRDRCQKLETERGRDRYSGRDRHRDKARDDESDRSRRYHIHNDRDDSYSNRDRRCGYGETEFYKDRNIKYDQEKDHSLKENDVNGDDDDQKDYQETLELKPTEHEEDDVDRIKEESRRRREAILQKYKAQKLQQQQQAVSQVLKVSDRELTEQPSQKLALLNAVQEENNGAMSDVKDASVVGMSFNLGKSSLGNNTPAEKHAVALGEGSPKSERSNDMFCDDIFGDSPAGVRKVARLGYSVPVAGKGDGLHVERSGLHDNWDDPDGYYSFRFGEILDSRYEITAAHGKGVFSTVVRAKDLKAGSGDPEEVAIKIIRNNETMFKAGTEELVILKKLVGADPDDRRHCVRYLSHFKYRNHLCIVFESLHMNLREVLKKFGRNIGLKLTAVRTYAKQLFIALKHLRNCGVLHCDIKPDNMLVNDSKNVLKLCDFGNAMFAGKNEITPYLVSRFYRSPEIILGLPYDHPMDMWSIGCCLYELYTGKVLFPGPSNNDMLRLHMELKGPFPKKMLRKGAFIEQHFDHDLNFLATEEDPVTKKTIRRLIVNIKPKDFGNIIRGSPGEDPKMLANFKDLLDKIFVLDPDKRLTVSQALIHPFITGK
ncbi:Serine/threonine-protein kinase PRP4-like protein [Bienertia sinuspersici]